jgi:hypothetical protein
MAQTAINRETGEILVLQGDQWQPAQRARNPQTGAEVFFDGTDWRPVPTAPQPAPTVAQSAARGAGLAARNFADIGAGAAAGAGIGALAGGVGAIPGALAGATAAALARPFSDLAVNAWNAATGGRQATPSQAVEGLMDRAGVPRPATSAERIVGTTTRAGVEALSGAGAARAIAGLPGAMAPAAGPSVGRGVAETLATGPGGQAAAAATAGGTTQSLLEAGAPTEVAVPVGMAASMIPTLRPQNVFPARNPPMREENLSILRRAGVPLTPAQELGNPSASVFEDVMRYLPTSAPRSAAAQDDAMRGYTRALLRQAGVDSDVATPDVLNAAQRAFGQRFDALEAATVLRPDQRFNAELGAMRQQYTRGLDESLYRAFDGQLQRVQDFAAARAQGAEMPGANYRVIVGELRTASNLAQNSDNPAIREYGKAMDRLRDSLEGLMERSAGRPPAAAPGTQVAVPGAPRAQLPAVRGQGQQADDLAERWRELNREYALFSRVREAMGGAAGGRDKINTGFIPPGAIAQAERASLGPEAYGMAQDPFTRLVRAGEAVLPNPTPNSGTAQRSFAQNLLTGARTSAAPTAALGAGGGGAAAAGMLDPVTGLAMSLGIPYAASRLWYGRPLTMERQGILGLQSLMGAEEAAGR